MSTAGSELLIREYAKRLKLPAVAACATRLAEEATAAGHGHLEFLAALLAAEVEQREANVEKARIRAARFPELKELSEFNFSLVPSLNPTQIGELAKGAWIDRREVLLTVGPPGTGKTHVCIALGLAACRRGRRVRFVTAAELVTELSEAQAEHRLSRLEQQLDRLDLLILDELGFVRFSADEAQLLFILLAHRYTRGALAISSNLEFADWTPIFNDDARMVAALLDRLTHRCHLLEFHAESYRFRQSLASRGQEERPSSDQGRRAANQPVGDLTERTYEP
ncbi:MAG: IS21-like element helper ATPase IstB [Actinobacteria bacterium]|nr:IS21-like element helper ATPase IstB [Actinomycetota bacterium]